MYPWIGAYIECFLDEAADVEALLRCYTGLTLLVKVLLVRLFCFRSVLTAARNCVANPLVLFIVVSHDARSASVCVRVSMLSGVGVLCVYLRSQFASHAPCAFEAPALSSN